MLAKKYGTMLEEFLNVGQNELTVSLRPSSYRATDHQKTDHHCPLVYGLFNVHTDHHCPLVYGVFNVHTDHLRLSPYPKKTPCLHEKCSFRGN